MQYTSKMLASPISYITKLRVYQCLRVPAVPHRNRKKLATIWTMYVVSILPPASCEIYSIKKYETVSAGDFVNIAEPWLVMWLMNSN